MLTDTFLKSQHLQQRDKITVFNDTNGLSVRISCKGKIVFQVRYTFNKKAYRLDLGTYPYMSLKDARLECYKAKQLLDQNKNPLVEKYTQNQQYITAKTLQECFELWYDRYATHNKKQHKEIKRSFELYVFPKIGKVILNEVTLQQWIILIESIDKKGIAERVFVNSKQMLEWCNRREIISDNPLKKLSLKNDFNITRNRRKRVLNDDEIIYFYKAIYGSHISLRNRILLELCLIYGSRVSELLNTKISHIQNNIWEIPATNHKTGNKTNKAIKRPILPYTQDLFDEVSQLSSNGYFFESSGNLVSQKHLTDITGNLIIWIKRHCGIDIVHFTIHDLRRTARTNFSRLTHYHIAEIMLGHSLGKLQDIYDQYDYLDEQKIAYQLWIDKLLTLKAIALQE